MNAKGIFVGVGAPPDVTISRLLTGLTGALVQSVFVSQKMAVFMARVNEQDLTTVGELMATGKVTAVIDRRYRLSEVRAPLVLNFMTSCEVEAAENGKLVFTTRPKSEGEKSAKVVMQFDPHRLHVQVEEIKLEDPTLTSVWGNALHRVQLVADHPEASGTFEIDFKKL